MKHFFLTLMVDAGRLGFYALIAGPAVMFYALVVLIALSGSPSQQFLDTARQLTDGAPHGRVMQCVSVEPSRAVQTLPEKDDTISGAPDWPPMPPMSLCHMEPVDSQFWTRPTDALLRGIWLTGALLGAVACFLTFRRSGQTAVSSDDFASHKKD